MSITKKGVVFLHAKMILNEFLLEITIKNYSERTKKSYRNNVNDARIKIGHTEWRFDL